MSHERIKEKGQEKRIEQEIALHSSIDYENIDWIYPNYPGIVKLLSYDKNVCIDNYEE